MDESLSQNSATERAYLVFEPRRAISSIRSWARRHAAELMCAGLLAGMSWQMLAVISRKSITIDEIVMIPAAYYHLVAGNFQLVNEHPPLSKIVSATPFLFIQPNEARPDQITAPPGSSNAKWAYHTSFWENNRARFDSLSFWPRVPMIFLTVLLGLLIFRFARQLFGARAAVLAVALFSLEPTVLAHGRVVQTDVPAAFGYLLFFMALYRYWLAPSVRRAGWLGLAAAVAILAKYSMLLVGVVLAFFFLVLLWRAVRAKQRPTGVIIHAASIALVILVLINAAYFFEHRSLADADLQWLDESFPANAALVTFAVRALSHLLPTEFVLGIFFQFWHNGVGHSAGLLGKYSQTGWWYYFPAAFALKTTLPFLLLALASLGWGTYQWARNKDGRFLWLLGPFALYTLFVLFSHIDIGVRYYLPAFPFLFVLGGVLLDKMLAWRRGRRAGALVAIMLVGWIAIEAWRAYPNHMSYMNQIASRAPHWWYLSDSNIEWGDDARGLVEFLRARGETSVGEAFLGGYFTMSYYGIDRIDALSPPASARARYLAIGASFLNGSTVPAGPPGSGRETDDQRANFFEEYRHRTPEAIIGNSIYVFRVQ